MQPAGTKGRVGLWCIWTLSPLPLISYVAEQNLPTSDTFHVELLVTETFFC